MAPENRPQGHDKKVGNGQGKVFKRGEGLNTGPVGTGSRPQGSASHNSSNSMGHGGVQRPQRPQRDYPSGTPVNRGTRSGFGIGKIAIILIVAFVIFGGGGSLFSGLLGGGTSDFDMTSTQSTSSLGDVTTTTPNGDMTMAYSGTSMPDIGGLFQMLMGDYASMPQDYSTYSTGGMANYNTYSTSNTPSLNTNVAPGSRSKYTSIVGSGADQVTIMVYMCGTDLESRSGMGTADLQEMAKATLSDQVNLIVFTGGCKSWRNQVVSSRVNQIYQVTGGGLKCLSDNAGTAAMTDPNNLTAFIKFCNEYFPANRNELIFWDHGSGSLGGYGYDEKNERSGSMTLAGIDQALKNAGCYFDFIGFDACLMGTVENGLMLSDYADYLIASEETEPGVGWYYTNWLTKLTQNTSMPTVEVGKNIVDDFVDTCSSKCPGQKATLAVIDLAELGTTVPDKLAAFSDATSGLIESNDGFKTVSKARNNTKEFAQSSKIDQIDFVDFTNQLGTAEAGELGDALLSSIKYNRTERSISNAYGLSIYWPYKKASKVSNMIKTYEQIGMDSKYTKCIKAFASSEQAGQYTMDGQGTPMASLYGGMSGNGGYATSPSSGYSTYSDSLGSLLGSLLMGRDHINTGFDESELAISKNSAGDHVIKLSEENWANVAEIAVNVFYDDGEGFIDLGLDNAYSYDKDNNLIADFSGDWMSVEGRIVAYYCTDTEGNTQSPEGIVFNGYIPAILNGDRVELMVVFDNEHPYGHITGARRNYVEGETETIAKTMVPLKAGDEIEFICDYYTYDGQYENTYKLGDPVILSNPDAELEYLSIDSSATSVTYKFTDLYQQEYWSPVVQ